MTPNNKRTFDFLCFGDSWDGIGTVVGSYWGSISVGTMISISVKSVVSTKTISAISTGVCGNWSSGYWGSGNWGSGISDWGMSISDWGSGDGNWGSYWLNVYVWLGGDFGVYVGFGSDFFMYIGFGSDFFMDVWFSSNLEVEVRFGSWVYLTGIIVWVDECGWGSGVCYWGSCQSRGSDGSSKTISVSSSSDKSSVSISSSIWVAISSIPGKLSLRIG